MNNNKKGVLPIVGVLSVFAIIAPALAACATDAPAPSATATQTETATGTQTSTSTEKVDEVPTIRWTNKVAITENTDGTGTAEEEGITTVYTKFDTTNKEAHVTLGINGSVKSTTRIKHIDSITVKFSENSKKETSLEGSSTKTAKLLLKTTFKNNEAGTMEHSDTVKSGETIRFDKALPDAFELCFVNEDRESEENADAKCVIESIIVTYTETERFGLTFDANASYDTYIATFEDGIFTRGEKTPNLNLLYNFKPGQCVAFKSPEDKDVRFDHTFNINNVKFTGAGNTAYAKLGQDKYETVFFQFANSDVNVKITSPEPIPFPEEDFACVGKYDFFDSSTGTKTVVELTKFGKVLFGEEEVGTFNVDKDGIVKISGTAGRTITLTTYGDALVILAKEPNNNFTYFVGAKQVADVTNSWKKLANDGSQRLIRLTCGEATYDFLFNAQYVAYIDGTKITVDGDLTANGTVTLSEIVKDGETGTLKNAVGSNYYDDKVEGGTKYSARLVITDGTFDIVRRQGYAGTYKTATGESTLVLDGFGNYDLDGTKGTHEKPNGPWAKQEFTLGGVKYIVNPNTHIFEKYVAPVDPFQTKKGIYQLAGQADSLIVFDKGKVTIQDKWTKGKEQTVNYTFKDNQIKFTINAYISEYSTSADADYTITLSKSQDTISLKLGTVMTGFYDGWTESDVSVWLYEEATVLNPIVDIYTTATTFTKGSTTITLQNGEVVMANATTYDGPVTNQKGSYEYMGTKIVAKLNFACESMELTYSGSGTIEFKINSDGSLIAQSDFIIDEFSMDPDRGNIKIFSKGDTFTK